MTKELTVTIEPQTSWRLVQRAALATLGIRPVRKPEDAWIEAMLKARHSVIRCMLYWIEVKNVPYYVAMHFVRHNVGVTWFVSTSREDRTGVPREERKQTDLVNMNCLVNAEALMNIANKRLCGKADPETRKVMHEIKNVMKDIDPIMARNMVPSCAYHNGKCYEFKPCGEKKD